MAGYSVLDDQVLRGRPRARVRNLGRLSAGYSPLDEQVLKGKPRPGFRGFGQSGEVAQENVDIGGAAASAASAAGTSWLPIVGSLTADATSVLKTISPLIMPGGTVMQTGAGGASYFYRAAAGSSIPTAQLLPTGLLSGGTSGNLLTWLLVAGAVVAAIAVLKR
jgi:hypothetical protein